jgi:hypothetical protein
MGSHGKLAVCSKEAMLAWKPWHWSYNQAFSQSAFQQMPKPIFYKNAVTGACGTWE